MASDLSILIIPMFGMGNLHLPLKKKLLAGWVFAIGIFAMIAATFRFYYGIKLVHIIDATWATMPMGNWNCGELMAGFIVACAPFIPRFVDQVFKRKHPDASASLQIHVQSVFHVATNSATDQQLSHWARLQLDRAQRTRRRAL
ncbi:hypothetical protein PFICI_11158 [Pestalotiopsis fici W106-1]|uniref:Rhodopsin domain-containing protein n=1 Tax=Pestalotiopsis fici (strain W106-1 / CGMCC3.15140) TaxID=1229662 RepID=W3WU21_PESFW|nr:uncharacterized protein PFICI_11158 [Pestalotiopsis fici W106-1]ETS77284.1 hypothetical protein PFICI_11158 [Pestalotiopsis fici W106-1]